MVNEKKQKLINELKELREQKGITYQQIADETEAHGEPVSLSTIKKVFSEKYAHDHDYTHVLKPIADVLTPPSDNDTLEIKTLQTRLELKEQKIFELEERLAKKEENYKEREAFYKEQINFFRKQANSRDEHINNRDNHIKNLDNHISRLNDAIDRKDALIRQLLLDKDKITEDI